MEVLSRPKFYNYNIGGFVDRGGAIGGGDLRVNGNW
jgi:hypothetical protein